MHHNVPSQALQRPRGTVVRKWSCWFAHEPRHPCLSESA